jgi:histidinol-phosphate/aromatic aminotransferase/cobyric acid decarboxylase-like protein
VRDASSFHGLNEEYSRVSIKLRKDNTILVEIFRKIFGA